MEQLESYAERIHRLKAEKQEQHVINFWNTACPATYKATEAAKLPHREQSDRVTGWKYSPSGLLLVGASRCGKTRSAWMLIERLSRDGVGVMAFDGLSWFISVAAAFSDLSNTHAFFDSVCSVDVLFLDDIFRGRMTEAQEVGLWGVIERRMAAGKPCIITTNATGKTLEDKCGPQIVPIIARLRECCEIVTFGV